MKKLIIIFVLFLCIQSNAQVKNDSSAISEYVTKDDKLIINFAWDNWSKLPSGVESKGFRSRGFSFMLMNEKMNKSGNVGIGGGLGFVSQNVHTDSYLIDSASEYVFRKIPDSLEYEVNKLSLNFISALIELRLRSNLNSKGFRFKFNVGFQMNYLVQEHVKYEDKTGKYKFYNVEDLSKFQYGVESRIGYSNYALFGYYSFVDVFEDGKGPELIPYSLGIAFTF